MAKKRKVSKRSAQIKRKIIHPKRLPKPKGQFCDSHLLGGLSIDDLDLAEYAKSGAVSLQTKYPDTVFTSGRRTIQQQADAMAHNVASKRQWIKLTYKPSPQRDALQKWVDDNPDATDETDISTGLKSVMDGWTDDQKANFSRHIVGLAFDIQPVDENADEIKDYIQKLPHLHKFLDKEGGLTIWHADFDAQADVQRVGKRKQR
jgi:hypothetical protein